MASHFARSEMADAEGLRHVENPAGEQRLPGGDEAPMAHDDDYDHEHHHGTKSVLAKVKEKAKKWRQTLAKKKHDHDEGNVTPTWGVSLDEEDDGEETQDPEYHGAPMYESEKAPNAYKEMASQHAIRSPKAPNSAIHQPGNRAIHQSVIRTKESQALHTGNACQEPAPHHLDAFKETSMQHTSMALAITADDQVPDAKAQQGDTINVNESKTLTETVTEMAPNAYKEMASQHAIQSPKAPNSAIHQPSNRAIHQPVIRTKESQALHTGNACQEPALHHLDEFKETSTQHTSMVPAITANGQVLEAKAQQGDTINVNESKTLTETVTEMAPNAYKEMASQHAIRSPKAPNSAIHQPRNRAIHQSVIRTKESQALHAGNARQEPALHHLDAFKETSTQHTSMAPAITADEQVPEAKAQQGDTINVNESKTLIETVTEMAPNAYKEMASQYAIRSPKAPNSAIHQPGNRAIHQSVIRTKESQALHTGNACQEPALHHLDVFKETSTQHTSTAPAITADKQVPEAKAQQGDTININESMTLTEPVTEMAPNAYKEMASQHAIRSPKAPNSAIHQPGNRAIHQSVIRTKESQALHTGNAFQEPAPHHLDAFKETSTQHTSMAPAFIADNQVPEAKAKQGDTINVNESKTLTETVTEMLAPSYNMVSDATHMIASKIQSPTAKDESGAKLMWDKGVSMKEYLMRKLEPGEEEKALSEVITEAISPRKAAGPGQGEEMGVVEKVKGAVSSLLGMEEITGSQRTHQGSSPIKVSTSSHTSSSPIQVSSYSDSSSSPIPLSTNPHAIPLSTNPHAEVEELGGRRLQAYTN